MQNAIIGVLIARHMLKRIRYGHFYYEIVEREAVIEKWAVGLLDTATDEETALSIIAIRPNENNPYHLLDLAMHARTKSVLAHRYADRFIEREWRGANNVRRQQNIIALPEEFSWVMLFLDIVCPVRYLKRKPQKIEKV